MIARPAPSLADPARPTATFSVGRRELLGPDRLLGPAELARVLCRAAERRVTILALTPGRLRRVDAWLDGDALVTHGAAPDPTVPVVGALCARHHAEALVRSIIESLVGPVPGAPAAHPLALPALTDLASGHPPAGADWLLVVATVPAAPASTERWCLAATPDGSVAATAPDHTTGTLLHPIDAAAAWSHVAQLLGDPPMSRTVSESVRDIRTRPEGDRAPIGQPRWQTRGHERPGDRHTGTLER